MLNEIKISGRILFRYGILEYGTNPDKKHISLNDLESQLRNLLKKREIVVSTTNRTLQSLLASDNRSLYRNGQYYFILEFNQLTEIVKLLS